MKRKVMGAAFGVLLLLGSAGLSAKPKEILKDADILGPDEGVLVYGYKTAEIDYLEFAQMDQNKPPQNVIVVDTWGFIYFCKPLPVSSKYKLVTMVPPDNKDYFSHQRIFGPPWAFTPGFSYSSIFDFDTQQQPGLQYAGNKLNFTNTNYLNLYGSSAELKYQQWCLKGMLKVFAGTRWEPVITAKIEELTIEIKSNKK